MLDQNWNGGTGSVNSPANGIIRKYLVMVNGTDRYGAKNYYVVD